MPVYNPRQESLLPGHVSVFAQEGAYLELIGEYALDNLIEECRWKVQVYRDIETVRLDGWYDFDHGWIVERKVGGRGNTIYRFQADYEYTQWEDWVTVRLQEVSNPDAIPAELLA